MVQSASDLVGKIGSNSDKVKLLGYILKPGCGNDLKEFFQTLDYVTLFKWVVGYKLLFMEDMEVPNCGIKDNSPMSYVNVNNKAKVSKGDTVYLSRFEGGLLLSYIEFDGRLTGDLGVIAKYIMPSRNSKNKIPIVCLALKDSEDYHRVSYTIFTKEIVKDPMLKRFEPCLHEPEEVKNISRNQGAKAFLDIINNRK